MKSRNLLHPHREGREEMEGMADAKIAPPAMLGPVPKEFADTVRAERPVRQPKPLIRCKVCTVVTTLEPECLLCMTRGHGVAAGVVDRFAGPYDQEDETQVLDRFLINNRRRYVPDVVVQDGWRHNGGAP